jgi:hypothetical protein
MSVSEYLLTHLNAFIKPVTLAGDGYKESESESVREKTFSVVFSTFLDKNHLSNFAEMEPPSSFKVKYHHRKM